MASSRITTPLVRCIRSKGEVLPAPADAPTLNEMVLEFFSEMDVIDGVPEPGARERSSVSTVPDYDPTAEMFRIG